MSEQEQIVIDVSPSGVVTIDAVGYEGNACSMATQQIELVLGGHRAAKKTDYKPEFSMPNSTSQTNKQTF